MKVLLAHWTDFWPTSISINNWIIMSGDSTEEAAYGQTETELPPHVYSQGPSTLRLILRFAASSDRAMPAMFAWRDHDAWWWRTIADLLGGATRSHQTPIQQYMYSIIPTSMWRCVSRSACEHTVLQHWSFALHSSPRHYYNCESRLTQTLLFSINRKALHDSTRARVLKLMRAKGHHDGIILLKVCIFMCMTQTLGEIV